MKRSTALHTGRPGFIAAVVVAFLSAMHAPVAVAEPMLRASHVWVDSTPLGSVHQVTVRLSVRNAGLEDLRQLRIRPLEPMLLASQDLVIDSLPAGAVVSVSWVLISDVNATELPAGVLPFHVAAQENAADTNLAVLSEQESRR